MGTFVEPAYKLERLYLSIQKRMEKVRIALYTVPLEVEKLKMGHETLLKALSKWNMFVGMINEYVCKLVKKFEEVGSNVVLCGRRVDPLPQVLMLAKTFLCLTLNAWPRPLEEK